ncbi:MAG: hypothetical protein U7M05_06875 [Candidatus Igneacidithiobacillus chanchocoensis]|jgi:seryl-tRNA synthetase
MENTSRKRHRRSAEERLADLEAKRQQMEARLREQMAKLEEQKRRLQENPKLKRERDAQRRMLVDRISRLASGWEATQILAAVAEIYEKVDGNEAKMQELHKRGEALMQELKPRRGRRPRNSI